jgi:hypothetical protein
MVSPLTVAIHQPNFFPWLGYFDKFARSDVFILLDDVQYPKTGANWVNRVRLRIAGAPAWATVPVVRSYSGTRLITEMQIDDRLPWRRKFLRTVEANYRRAAHFEDVFPVIEDLIAWPGTSMADFNVHAILVIAERLTLDPARAVRSSSLQASGSATDRLISLVQAVGGATYLCGGGADGYQEDEKFAAAGLHLQFQEFQHPRYPQGAFEFVAGLSILDALCHCGWMATRTLLGTPRVVAS